MQDYANNLKFQKFVPDLIYSLLGQDGIPRTAYKGVVVFRYRTSKRVFFVGPDSLKQLGIEDSWIRSLDALCNIMFLQLIGVTWVDLIVQQLLEYPKEGTFWGTISLDTFQPLKVYHSTCAMKHFLQVSPDLHWEIL